MKINKWRKYRRLVYLALTYVLLALLISFWLVNKKIETSFNPSWQPTEVQQAKAYLLEKVGYKNFRKLSRVAFCESGWDIEAYNAKTNDNGIFQINIVWADLAEQLKLDYKGDFRDNIDLALVILQKQGISAWKASFS